MRTLLLLAFSLPVFGQVNVSIPIQSIIHAPHVIRHASKAQRFMLVTNLAVHALNIADAYTTYRGVVVGPDCETNPLLRTSPDCRAHNLSAWRFGFAKGLIAGAAIAEYSPTWTRQRSDSYYLFMGILNLGASVPLGLADAGNIKVLSRN